MGRTCAVRAPYATYRVPPSVQKAHCLDFECLGAATSWVISASLKKPRGNLYTDPALSTVLNCCQAWLLRKDFFQRLRSSHNRRVRSLCRISIAHTIRHSITLEGLFNRLSILDPGSYYHSRILRWAGYAARMPMSRAPRQLLNSCLVHPRSIGCPNMSFGRTASRTCSGGHITPNPANNLCG
jgi:hypothetical protein